MNFDQFGKTYAELTEEERKIVDERMKKLRKQEAELSMEQLEKGVLGGTTSDIGKEAFNGTFSEPIKNIDLVDEDGNELTEQELENALGGVPYDVGEEQFKKRV